MKRSILIVLCLLLFNNVVFADPIQETKVVTVFPIYINNAGTAFDKDLGVKLVETLNSTLANNYSLVQNDTYKVDFEKLQIKDLSKAEKADIVEVFKNKADYVVIAEIEPILNENTKGILTQKVTSRGSLYLRIVDVNANKYLTNESISYKDRDSLLSVSYLSILKIAKKPITMRNLEKVFKQAAEKIAITIPKARTSEINGEKSIEQGNELAEKG